MFNPESILAGNYNSVRIEVGRLMRPERKLYTQRDPRVMEELPIQELDSLLETERSGRNRREVITLLERTMDCICGVSAVVEEPDEWEIKETDDGS